MKMLFQNILLSLLLSVASLALSEGKPRHWFSGSVRDPKYPTPGLKVQEEGDGSRNLQAINPRLFDITVSLTADPEGDDDGSTQDVDPTSSAPGGQDAYEKAFQFFADAVYESTEGAHKIRKVRIFRNSERFSTVDIQWTAAGHPSARLNGLGVSGEHIFMYSSFTGGLNGGSLDLLSIPMIAGYTLGHEWGHYALGVFDEYSLQAGDEPVVPSIMNSQFDAVDFFTQTLVDPGYLQFSIKRVSGGPFEDTGKTAHHRELGESIWETLSRPSNLLDPFRNYYPELALVAPAEGSPPSITDLPGSARSDLEILWSTSNVVYSIVIDASGSMFGTKIANTLTAAKLLVDLAEFGSSIGVISFDFDATIVFPITTITDQATKDAVKSAIDTIVADGGTSIGEAAQAALDELENPSTPDGTKVVFLLSDGVSSDDALAPIPQYQAAQIPIFAFSYGSDADTTTLRALAEQSSGELYISPVALAAVSQAFQAANTLAASDENIESGQVITPPNTFGGIQVNVDSGFGRINVIVTFLGDAATATVTLQDPDGTTFEATETNESGGETLVLFSVDNPTAGNWIILVDTKDVEVPTEYQVSGSPVGPTLSSSVATPGGKRAIVYPEPLIFATSLGLELPVLNAVVDAEITAPDGTVFVLPMNDDGSFPDMEADDGVYSVALNYDQSGVYDVQVRVTAEAGVATQSAASLQPAPGLYGLVPFDDPVPLEETITRFERAQLEVEGVMEDDHVDSFDNATVLVADNTLVPGRIDSAGDVDVFLVDVPVEAGNDISIRISDLAFGMDPILSIFDATQTLISSIGQDESVAQGGYLAISVPNPNGEDLFAQVSHQSPDGVGWYQISAGSVLFADLEPTIEDPVVFDCNVLCQILNKLVEYLFSFWN